MIDTNYIQIRQQSNYEIDHYPYSDYILTDAIRSYFHANDNKGDKQTLFGNTFIPDRAQPSNPRVLKFVTEREEYEHQIKKYLEDFMAMAKGNGPYSNSREIGRAFCETCDPLFTNWNAQGTFTKALLHMTNQLKFIPDKNTCVKTNDRTTYIRGKFSYTRQFKGIFKFFPPNYHQA